MSIGKFLKRNLAIVALMPIALIIVIFNYMKTWQGLLAIAPFVALLLIFTFGGPFRPPSYDREVVLSKEDQFCITSIHGTVPNLPHDPRQWIWGGRSEITYEIHTPGSKGKFDANKINWYTVYAGSKDKIKATATLSGYVEFEGNNFILNLINISQNPYIDGEEKPKPFHENGTYLIKNPEGCM